MNENINNNRAIIDAIARAHGLDFFDCYELNGEEYPVYIDGEQSDAGQFGGVSVAVGIAARGIAGVYRRVGHPVEIVATHKYTGECVTL